MKKKGCADGEKPGDRGRGQRVGNLGKGRRRMEGFIVPEQKHNRRRKKKKKRKGGPTNPRGTGKTGKKRAVDSK